ncbi:MAG: MarR family transcriptional regulator [Candidatus Nanoarchaeia archaeon]|nr:MarR family transcriptional regulator [Candidatus Nanoarchaeia archaeon]
MANKNLGYSLIAVSLILLVILLFVKADMDEQGAYLCKLVEADPNLSLDNCPAHESKSSWLLIGAIIVVVLGLGAGISMILPKKLVQAAIKVDTSKLNSEEKNVYNLLKDKNGIYQSDLIKETGFSKVKITRILDKLESKGIIERRRRGMTNAIFLK